MSATLDAKGGANLLLFLRHFFADCFLLIRNEAEKFKKLGALEIFKYIFSTLFVGGVTKKYERSWKSAALFFIPFIFIFTVVDYNYIHSPIEGISLDGRCWLDIAYQKSFCNQISHTNNLLLRSKNKILDLNTPNNQLFYTLEKKFGHSCETAQFKVMNENSLSNMYTVFFKFFPSISLNQLGVILKYIRISLILLFAFVLLKVGLSPAYTLLVTSHAHFLVYLVNINYQFAMYPFLIPNFLFLISVSLLYLYGLEKYGYRCIPFGALLGFYAAFYCNFRTAHAPLSYYILLTLLALTYLYLRKSSLPKIKACVIALSCFLSLYVGFRYHDNTFIKPIHEETKLHGDYNYTYHAIAHPLVLSMGTVPSDLAKREGIFWNDGAGMKLVHQIDPKIKYLDKNYEKALWVYYFKLWLFYPSEVLKIYKRKMKLFNRSMFSLDKFVGDRLERYLVRENTPHAKQKVHVENPLLKGTLWLQSSVNNVSWKIWVILLSPIFLIVLFYRRFNQIGLLLSLSVVGCCLLLSLEGIIIVNVLTLKYHALINLLFISIVLYYIQMVFNFLYQIMPSAKEK